MTKPSLAGTPAIHLIPDPANAVVDPWVGEPLAAPADELAGLEADLAAFTAELEGLRLDIAEQPPLASEVIREMRSGLAHVRAALWEIRGFA